ncbi:flavin reductase family protein, partial [Halorhodospira halochloris]
GRPVAMTVNSFTGVSLNPPLVLWSAQRDVGPFDAFMASPYYAVHVLHAGQRGVADHFAQDIKDKFTRIPYLPGIGELPLLDDFTARFQCRVRDRLDGGDHVILMGEVLEVRYRPAEPLIFHAGHYLD